MAGSHKPFARIWESYKRKVLPSDAPQVQIIECRRAFYAGAAGLFDVIMNRLEPGDGVSAGETDFMESLMAELKEYGASQAWPQNTAPQ